MRAKIKNLIEAREAVEMPKSSVQYECEINGITKKNKEGKPKSKISQKTYYLMEKGEDVKEEFFEAMVQLLNKKSSKKQYQLRDIINDKLSTTNTESCYLYKVNSVNDLRKSISESISASLNWHGSKIFKEDTLRKRVFYDIEVNPIIKDNIKDLFDSIVSIKQSEFKKKLPLPQQIHQEVIEQVNNEENEYFIEETSFKKDIEDLDIQSKGNNSINKMREINNTCLYVGNITVPIVDFENTLNPNLNTEIDKEERDDLLNRFSHPDGYWEKYTPIVVKRTYTLFYFSKCLGDTVEATYKIPQSFEKLNKILKNNFKHIVCYTYPANKGDYSSNPVPIPSLRADWAAKKINLQFTAEIDKFEFKRVDNQALQSDINKRVLEEREKEIKDLEKSANLDAREQQIYLAKHRIERDED